MQHEWALGGLSGLDFVSSGRSKAVSRFSVFVLTWANQLLGVQWGVVMGSWELLSVTEHTTNEGPTAEQIYQF